MQNHPGIAADGHPSGEELPFENHVLLPQGERLGRAPANDICAAILEDDIALLVGKVGGIDSFPAIAERLDGHTHSAISKPLRWTEKIRPSPTSHDGKDATSNASSRPCVSSNSDPSSDNWNP